MKFIIAVLVISFLVSVLSGCSTLAKLMPDKYDGKAERYETLADVGVAEYIPVPVYEMQEYPSAQVITNPKDGKDYAAFDKDGFYRLMELRAQHRHNTKQLKEANEVIQLQVRERNEIYEIGLNMQEQANLQAQKVELREKELSAERRKNFVQRWIERGVFAVLVYFAVI